MTSKICTNATCPAYARLVYTLAMRCVLCRCDLTAAHRSIEMGVRHGHARLAEGLARKSARIHPAK
jgi:hypothetical protein